MSPYWFIAFIAWSIALTGVGYEFKGYQDKAAEDSDIIAGQKHLIGVKDQTATITNGVNNGYQTGIKAIDDLYSTAPEYIGLHPSSNSVSALPSPTGGIPPRKFSLKYHLTFKSCDIEEAKLTGLWNRDVSLAAIK